MKKKKLKAPKPIIPSVQTNDIDDGGDTGIAPAPTPLPKPQFPPKIP